LTKVFGNYTQQELDAQYNQRAWVPHADEIIARLSARSDEVRARLGSPESISFGKTELEVLDIYGGRKDKAFVFVHGGAWQRESRRGSAFGAEPVVRAGASFVVLGFASIPRVTLPEMAAQVRRGIEWVLQNLSRDVVVFGHSSGAHLTACALTTIPDIRKGMVVSGLYDLRPVRLSARQAYVKLDDRMEDELSPIRHLGRIRCPVTVAWADGDSDEFRRQGEEFARSLKAISFQVKNVNHFEIVETLGDPTSPVGRAALKMLE
jgi:arylformamidase